ncbi:BTB/POZ domain-containing protein KCTD5-like [Sycon ciliatum]|uniref:BTB/POZ domain-containing protein KCTD5-like n=1 Tax=Sycon ciliatum TaxID=27933 RepID=UPI0020AB9D92|eukprot:scpid92909/ scgid35631/ BTB/POZ domain-containing protein KCTD5
MGERNSLPSEWVRLNVGGKLFMTTRSTLCKREDSFLSRLCQDDPGLPTYKDENGAYLIDRDPDYFSPILNYLRHGKLCVNEGVSMHAILEEAEFYNIASLVTLVKQQLDEPKSEDEEKTMVYRVLSCRERELTQMLSTMSRGWKCEQVIPLNHSYSQASDHTEFLLVVSRSVERQPVSPFSGQSDKLSRVGQHC